MKRRNTHQRQAVLDVISGANIHMTAEDVKNTLDEENLGIGLATVYRNLNLLVEEGKIQRLGNGLFDGNPVPHDHIHCVKCGKWEDFETQYEKRLDKKAREAGMVIFHHTVTYEGICKECLEKEEDTTRWN